MPQACAPPLASPVTLVAMVIVVLEELIVPLERIVSRVSVVFVITSLTALFVVVTMVTIVVFSVIVPSSATFCTESVTLVMVVEFVPLPHNK